MSEVSWQDTLRPLFVRYRDKGQAGMDQMCKRVDPALARQAVSLADYAAQHLDALDEAKANRWLGFVQGILIAGGLTTVQVERDFTRPLFHALKGPSASHEV